MNHHESNCRQKRTTASATAQQLQTESMNSVSNTQYNGFVFQTSSTNNLKSIPRVNVKVNLADQDDTTDIKL